jgi:hypothetical protein
MVGSRLQKWQGISTTVDTGLDRLAWLEHRFEDRECPAILHGNPHSQLWSSTDPEMKEGSFDPSCPAIRKRSGIHGQRAHRANARVRAGRENIISHGMHDITSLGS